MPNSFLTTAELAQLVAALPPLTDAPSAADAASPILRQLAFLKREQLAGLITEQTCIAGEVVVEEGAAGDAMYIVRSGLLVVYKGGFQAPTFLGYRGPGAVVGEMALVDDQPRSASGVALKSGKLLRVGRESFQRLVHDNPDLGMSILRVISARLRASDSVYRASSLQAEQLVGQVSQLETEKQQLLELQRLRQETSDLIVHDLRNPLNSIYCSLRLLRMVLPEDVLQANGEILDIADSGCDRILNLVNTLLDVARMEAGETALDLARLSLPDLIATVVRRLPAFASGEVKLQVAVPATLPDILADQDKLDRVLTNLIDNALKYTPAGGQVSVMAGIRDGRVQVSVMDTGPGIPPEERERIFERFAQTAGEKRRRRGFGLGLAFCRLTVEAHGGQIWVETGDGGVGSRFVFTLPTAERQK